MNEDTLVVVHCYSGDEEQVRELLPEWLHHECPVLLLSPEDAPVVIDHPQVECQSAGRRAYEGQLTLDRQRAHFEIIRQRPEKWLFLNDSDSVCIDPELPDYLYYDERTVWGNELDARWFLDMKGGSPTDYRRFHFVYHPPWFLSQGALGRMLEHSDAAMEDCPEYAKLIDYYIPAMARRARLKMRSFYHSISFPFQNIDQSAICASLMAKHMNATMFHSIKKRAVLDYVKEGA